MQIDQKPMSLKEEKSQVMVPTPGTIPPSANTKNLPQCRVRRTYTCVHCKLLTQNPRDHLYHLKDVHKERVRIYECTHCIYASKQYQKLVRHGRMVHGIFEVYDSSNSTSRSLRRTTPASLPQNTNYQENSENRSEFEDRSLVNNESFNEANVTEEQIFTKCTMNSNQRKIKENPSEDFYCKLCSFKTNSKYLLLSHEKDHTQNNSFRCEKCSYATHIKARYTKHVKYHSMPMIKCDMCDFQTPYKWNLDRHSKNHNGNGTFKCAICNFTADIKQSLTVHEMNHHVPPVGSVGVGFNRKRNKVGGSDNCGADEILIDSVADLDYDMFDEQMPGVLIRNKRKSQKDCTPMKKCRIDDSELSEESDEQPQYVQNKCQFCEFKTAWNTEMVQHEISFHNFDRSKNNNQNDKNKKKFIKPLPNLIPIKFDRNNQREILQSNRSNVPEFDDIDNNNENDDNIEIDDVELENLQKINYYKNNLFHKNSELSKISNSLFFTKVKERLLTGGDKESLICKKCGYMATCLTDIESHQKMCQEDEINEMNRNENKANELSITATRCPFCRLRCKTSVELQNHLTICSAIDINESEFEIEQSTHEIVFEENNLNDKSNMFNSNLTEEIEIQPEIGIMDFDYDESDGQEHESDNDNESGNDDKLDGKKLMNNIRNDYKQVFKCPYCDFKSSIVSKFHVHLINHSDRKPYECSTCDYQSVWRWDIAKHIKMKQSKDQSHYKAQVITIDETGRRNYSKYNQYLVRVENDSNDNSNSCNESDELQSQNDFELTNNNSNDTNDDLPSIMSESNLISNNHREKSPLSSSPPTINRLPSVINLNESFSNMDLLNTTQRFFKCKRCGFTNSSRENMITHIQIMHNKNSTIQQVSILNNDVDESNFTREKGQFRCAHCNQISNWKHVIQRHCRLKHNGDIKVIIINKFGVEKLETEDTGDDNMTNEQLSGNQQEGSFKCSHCDFSCDSFMEFELHFNQHSITKTSNNCETFKCVYCEVIFDDEFDLNEHLIQNHGMISTDVTTTNPVTSPKDHCYECHLCNYNTDAKQDFFHHFQTCHSDNYQENIVDDDDDEEDNISQSDSNVLVKENDNMSTNVTLNVDEQNDNKVHDLDTKHFTDIPLVWVSRMGNFVKMYKCRYCPHVNFRKININDHEKMHRYRETDPAKPNDVLHYCTDCSYVCNNAGVLSSHSKVHRGFFGVIHCLVDFSKSDQEQINELMDAIQSTNSNQKTKSNDLCFDLKLIAYEFTGDNFPKNSGDNNSSLLVTNYNANNSEVIDTVNQLLSFCNQCPARFLSEDDMINHKRFHSLKLIHRCICCSYTAKQKPHILAHDKVHMKDYQTKTNILLRTFRINEQFMPPKLITVMKESDSASRLLWVVNSADLFKLHTKPNTTKMSQCYSCSKCPAKFFKEDALNYHSNLHGKNSPYKCSSCDYAAKNVVSLERHQSLHRNQSIQITNKSTNMVSLSGTDITDEKINLERSQHDDSHQVQHFDPQFGTLINGNPNFIYPTCLKKGKLKEKRYKCHKCPSAFEKREQYRVHLTLHGSKQKYTCEYCDYSVKYYANITQHIKKHEMHNEALAIKQMEVDQSQHKNIQSYLNPEQLLVKQDQELEEHEKPNSDVDNNNTIQQIDHISQNSSFFEIKKLHTCQLCPYSNYRKDAVDSHLKRHISVSGVRHVHVCNYCDYTVPQAHFLREHERLHCNKEIVNMQTDDEKVNDITNQNNNSRYACLEIEEKIFEKFAEKKDD